MRNAGFLLGFALLLLVGTANAENSPDSGATVETVSADVSNQLPGSGPSLFAASDASPSATLHEATISGIAVPSAIPGQAPGVQSVFQTYNWQIYTGYTYMHFFEAPNISKNLNGLNIAVDYFPWAGHFGLDGEFIATFGSQSGQTAKFADGLGGVRFRYAVPRGVELWAHGLVGGAKFLPQTAFGGQTGLSYELGGGADFGGSTRRWALRAAVDMVATHFFSTSQYSPKISGGFVYKF
jgi:hypothetical protein